MLDELSTKSQTSQCGGTTEKRRKKRRRKRNSTDAVDNEQNNIAENDDTNDGLVELDARFLKLLFEPMEITDDASIERASHFRNLERLSLKGTWWKAGALDSFLRQSCNHHPLSRLRRLHLGKMSSTLDTASLQGLLHLMPGLRELSLDHCPSLTSLVIDEQHAPELVSLRVSHCAALINVSIRGHVRCVLERLELRSLPRLDMRTFDRELIEHGTMPSLHHFSFCDMCAPMNLVCGELEIMMPHLQTLLLINIEPLDVTTNALSTLDTAHRQIVTGEVEERQHQGEDEPTNIDISHATLRILEISFHPKLVREYVKVSHCYRLHRLSIVESHAVQDASIGMIKLEHCCIRDALHIRTNEGTKVGIFAMENAHFGSDDEDHGSSFSGMIFACKYVANIRLERLSRISQSSVANILSCTDSSLQRLQIAECDTVEAIAVKSAQCQSIRIGACARLSRLELYHVGTALKTLTLVRCPSLRHIFTNRPLQQVDNLTISGLSEGYSVRHLVNK